MRYLLSLLLIGCSYTPTNELENQLFACDNAHAIGCDLIRIELERRYKRQEKHKECPPQAKCYYGDNARRVLRSW